MTDASTTESPTTTNDSTSVSRRVLLGTALTSGLTTLAGCSSLLGGSNSTDSPTATSEDGQETTVTSDIFADTQVEGAKLRIDFTASDHVNSVDKVNVVGPEGQSAASKRVQTGTRSLSIGLLPNYQPGKHRIVAVDGETVVDEATIQLEPNIKIVDVGVGQNNPDMGWSDENPRWQLNTFATIKNTGTGPQQVTNLEFSGVPHPTAAEYGYEEVRFNGSRHDVVNVPPETQVTIYSIVEPFEPVEGACEDTEMKAIVRTAIGEDVTENYHVGMDGDSLLDNCTITIKK